MRRIDASLTLSVLGIAMLAARVCRTGSLELAFLGWNLALAWAPVGLASIASWLVARDRVVAAVAATVAWWLFFPNAIYLVTDLIYAGAGHGVLRWYDVAMLAVFAFAGGVIAMGSLERMRALVASRAGEWPSWAFAASVWLSSGIGVWLGRVRRWNSWDVLFAPGDIVRDAAHLLLAPRAHASAWVIALVFAALLGALQLGAPRRTA
jgi:uncharacterized membrane protein